MNQLGQEIKSMVVEGKKPEKRSRWGWLWGEFPEK
jgi:hypothetical protein